MKIVLEGPAIKEIFKEYATPAMRDEVRKRIQAEMDGIIMNEIKKKTENYVTTSKIESVLRNALSSDVGVFRKTMPKEEMERIVIEAFQKRADRVDFKELEETLLQEAREMIEAKMIVYKKIMKDIVENQL